MQGMKKSTCKSFTDKNVLFQRKFDFLDIFSQVYIPKRCTLIQVLPPANAYTKSDHAYIDFAKFFIAILRQNAYMYEQIT